jgi:secreted trypsin-like serine protease
MKAAPQVNDCPSRANPGRRAWWFVVTVVCWLPPAAQAIETKSSSEATNYPEAVLISSSSRHGNGASRCTGVLIDSRVVLTAAHGVVDFEAWEVTAPYAKGGPATVKATTMRPHPDFDPKSFENDLAILILETPIELQGPFAELHQGDLCRIGSKLTLIGRVNEGKVQSDRLFQGTVERTCIYGNINLYGGFPRVAERGDSGGPVFIGGDGHELVGIIVGGLMASRANVPLDVYAPITEKNRRWALNQVPGEPPSAERASAAGAR